MKNMENKNMISVEWLDNAIKDLIPNDIGSQLKYKNKIEQAIKMNEIEIISSYQQGCIDGYEPHYGNGKDYYRETYNR